MPGTNFKATYHRANSEVVRRVDVLQNDLNAKLSLRDFIALADTIANDKARELGWIV